MIGSPLPATPVIPWSTAGPTGASTPPAATAKPRSRTGSTSTIATDPTAPSADTRPSPAYAGTTCSGLTPRCSPDEAVRCLKRQLARHFWKLLYTNPAPRFNQPLPPLSENRTSLHIGVTEDEAYTRA